MKVIRGKRALVTGAASGIGRAIALALAREGANVDLLDIDQPGMQTVVQQANHLGVEAVPYVCDLSQPADIEAVLQAYLADDRELDILVNNAGVAYHGPTDTMLPTACERLLQINLLAPISITRQLLPTLLTRPESHLLNVSSIFGLVAADQTAAYHASKYGLVGFSESLRTEYARLNLGVTVLCPGFTRTNLYRAAGSGREGPIPTPPDWLCTRPEQVARQAIRAIYRNRGLVVVSALARFLWYSKRYFPGLIGSIYRARLRDLDSEATSAERESS